MTPAIDTQETPSRTRRALAMLATLIVLGALGALGFAAFGNEAEDAVSFVEYVTASVEVLDVNGFEPQSGIDCGGSTDAKEVICTGTTTEGLSIESTGENLGQDDATLTVSVDGQVLYDGLLDDAH